MASTYRARRDQGDWPALQGPHNAQKRLSHSDRSSALGVSDENRGRPPHLPRPPAPHGAHPREGRRRSSSTTARRPTRPRPLLRSPRSSASAGSAAGRRRPTISTNARRTSATCRSAYTIGEAADLFERLLSPHMPVKNCGKLDEAVRSGRCGCEPVIRCCCRRPARASTSSGISRTGGTSSAQLVEGL